MNTLKHILLYVTATVILFACRNNPESVQLESNLIEITNQQFATDEMQLGEMGSKAFESTVKCSGSIVPQSNGIAKVNAPISGVIKNIYCHNGQFVEKNQPLLEITGNEIIDIQKDFAEASAHYKRLKNDYDRIKSLYIETITSEKEYIVAESEYKASMARYNGLKMKIDALDFSISKIENGEFYSSYSIKAPIKGQISSLMTNIGQYVDSQFELAEIIDPSMFQLKLSVFAPDMANLKKGQTVRFKSVNSGSINLANISSIGIVINNDSKSIECYASIADKMPANPIANEFAESEIITDTDTVTALPSTALIRNETGNFILVLSKQENDKYYFSKVEVKIGRQYGGFSEILEAKIEGKILTDGVYNISL